MAASSCVKYRVSASLLLAVKVATFASMKFAEMWRQIMIEMATIVAVVGVLAKTPLEALELELGFRFGFGFECCEAHWQQTRRRRPLDVEVIL